MLIGPMTLITTGSGCGGTLLEEAPLATADESGTDEVVPATPAVEATETPVVDGTVTPAVEPVAANPEAVCDDLLDDDANGLIDCEDSACAGATSCADGDGDTFLSNIDCDDANPDINPDALEIIGNGTDEDCDGNDVDLATAIRVSSTGDDAAECTVETPCLTLERALLAATEPRAVIIVDSGDFALTGHVVIDKPVGIFGGFDGVSAFDPATPTVITTDGFRIVLANTGTPRDPSAPLVRTVLHGLTIVTTGHAEEFTIKDSSPLINNVTFRSESVGRTNSLMFIHATAASTHPMNPTITNSKFLLGETTGVNTRSTAVIVNNASTDSKLTLNFKKNIVNTGVITASSASFAAGLLVHNDLTADSRVHLSVTDNKFGITESDVSVGIAAHGVSGLIAKNHINLAGKAGAQQTAIRISGKGPGKVVVSGNLLKTDVTTRAATSRGISSKGTSLDVMNNTLKQGLSGLAINLKHFAPSSSGAVDKLRYVNNVMINDASSRKVQNLHTTGTIETDFTIVAFKNNNTSGATANIKYVDKTAGAVYSDTSTPKFPVYLNGLVTDSVSGNIFGEDPLMTMDTSGEVPVITLDASSPLIDKGLNPPMPVDMPEKMPLDAQGNPRFVGGTIDIGAIEAGAR
jgi:hypothetical protein